MNKNILVTTLPIKPQKKINIGMCIAPFLMDLVSSNLECSSVFSVNLLHSYDFKENDLEKYINKVKSLGLRYDDIFIDKEWAEKLLFLIKQMIKENKIIEKKGSVIRCSCGKVDIIKNGIRDFDNAGDIYYKKDGKLICKCCNSECKEYYEDGLYLHLDEKVDDHLQIFPPFLANSTNHFSKQYKGIDYLISKKRNTGYAIKYNDKIYNIDVDFLWMNYVSLFKQDKQILIASNHQLFEMYLLNYINKIVSNKDLYFIATPYIKNPTLLNLDDEFSNKDYVYPILCLIYTLKWKTNDVSWDKSIFKGIDRLSEREQLHLYKHIYSNLKEINDNELIDSINSIFNNKINFQRNLKLVKEKK